nr:MAG TPA_asm: hypothetical protein [Caudoviricetes sp.]
MSKTHFNKNNTVSIIGLTKDEYNALRSIVYSSKRCFDEPDEDEGYYSNDDFVCLLLKEEKQALDNLDI